MADTVFDRIQSEVDANPVFLYMKGTPMFPQCGFSARVVQILSHLGVPFSSANVLEEQELREGVKAPFHKLGSNAPVTIRRKHDKVLKIPAPAVVARHDASDHRCDVFGDKAQTRVAQQVALRCLPGVCPSQ